MLWPAQCLRQNPLPEASIATAVTRSNRNTGWPKPQNEPTLGRNLNRWRILSEGLQQEDNYFRLVYWLKASSYSEHLTWEECLRKALLMCPLTKRHFDERLRVAAS